MLCLSSYPGPLLLSQDYPPLIGEGKKRNTGSATSVMMTRAAFSHESSSLANCRPLNVCVPIVAWLLYDQSKKLVFMPTASATASAHRDRLFVASFAQQPNVSGALP